MTLFFLVVGLEAKRELDLGELRERRRLAIPVFAAIGGDPCRSRSTWPSTPAAPAPTAGAPRCRPTPRSRSARWRCSRRGPRPALRVFLLTLAVVDDLAALVVIATVYTGHVSVVALAVAVALFAALLALRLRRRSAGGRSRSGSAVAIWVAMFKSGHRPGDLRPRRSGWRPAPTRPSREDLERATALARSFREQPTPELARSAQQSLLSAISPNERLQYGLHPWTSYVIVPLFALANAGIHLTGKLLERRGHARRSRSGSCRLRRRQADRHLRRLVARLAARRCTGRARRSAGRCSRGRRVRRDRLHGLAADLEPRVQRRAARRGEARRARHGGRSRRCRLGGRRG